MAAILEFPADRVKMQLRGVSAFYRSLRAIERISLQVPRNTVTAIIGPSGCGKSTLIRTMNRMHEVTPGARVEGEVLLDGEDIYVGDAVDVRRRVGMVFQKAKPVPDH